MEGEERFAGEKALVDAEGDEAAETDYQHGDDGGRAPLQCGVVGQT